MRTARVFGGAALATAAFLFLSSFRKTPKGVAVVQHFNPRKYVGTWYEIARFDYRWEKNLEKVTATYSLNSDGSIKVDNRGYDIKKQEWRQSLGKAKLVAPLEKDGRLKVSFFGPFYAGYNVVAIDEDYQHALVIGESKEYMWILSRKKTIPEEVKQRYLSKAKSLGLQIEKLVWVKQE